MTTTQSPETAQEAITAARFRLLGTNVRHHRRRLGLSQRELAAAAGLVRQTISRVERGCYPLTLAATWRIADALGVSEITLLRDPSLVQVARQAAA